MSTHKPNNLPGSPENYSDVDVIIFQSFHIIRTNIQRAALIFLSETVTQFGKVKKRNEQANRRNIISREPLISSECVSERNLHYRIVT